MPLTYSSTSRALQDRFDAQTQAIGMLFVDFEKQRSCGSTERRYREAQFIVRVTASRIYPNGLRTTLSKNLVGRVTSVYTVRHIGA